VIAGKSLSPLPFLVVAWHVVVLGAVVAPTASGDAGVRGHTVRPNVDLDGRAGVDDLRRFANEAEGHRVVISALGEKDMVALVDRRFDRRFHLKGSAW
jgi:hypothetical protein